MEHQETQRLSGKTNQNPPTATQVVNFGKYKIIREIGRGGMGFVYQAYDTKLQRYVAIKLIKNTDSYREQEQRFLREAQTIAQLKHPNIISVYDFGTQNGYPYFVMDYIEGGSLRSLIKKGSLTTRQIAQIMVKISEAMHYAHQQGIIHRDLKPDNILMDDLEPKVMDFGIAKVIRDEKKLSKTGTIYGSPQYMPPEQAYGKSNVIDARSDVYSLGAILYCMLTGNPPFTGNSSMKVLQQVVNALPVPPSKIRSTVPRELESICLKTLEKKRAHRYRSAQDLADDINNYLEGRPISARSRTSLHHYFRTLTRYNYVFIPAIVSCLFLGLMYWFLQSSQQEKTKKLEWQISQLEKSYEELRKGKQIEALGFAPEVEFLPQQGKVRCYLIATNNIDSVFANHQGLPINKEGTRFEGELLVGYGRNYIVFRVLTTSKKWIMVEKEIVRDRPYQEFMYLGDPQRTGKFSMKPVLGAVKQTICRIHREIETQPIVVDNIAYFGSRDNNFYFWNISKNEAEWTFRARDDIETSAIYKGAVYFGCEMGYFYAMDIHNKQLLWERHLLKTHRDRVRWHDPLFINNSVYIADRNQLFKLDCDTGKLFWEKSFEDAICTTLCYTNKYIIARFYSGKIIAIHPESGDIHWERELPSQQNDDPETAIVVNGMVYINSGKDIYGLDSETGTRKWQYRGECNTNTSPHINNDKLFFGCDDGHIHEVDINNKKEHKILTTKNSKFRTPIAIGEFLYICGRRYSERRGRDSAKSHIYVYDLKQRKIIKEHDISGRISDPFFQEDTIFFAADETLYSLK